MAFALPAARGLLTAGLCAGYIGGDAHIHVLNVFHKPRFEVFQQGNINKGLAVKHCIAQLGDSLPELLVFFNMLVCQRVGRTGKVSFFGCKMGKGIACQFIENFKQQAFVSAILHAAVQLVDV